MSEKQITNRMGLPDRVVSRPERLRSRTWIRFAFARLDGSKCRFDLLQHLGAHALVDP